MKVEIAVLGSPSLTVLKVSLNNTCRSQELCESPGGHPGLSVPISPCGLCGRKATLNLNTRMTPVLRWAANRAIIMFH